MQQNIEKTFFVSKVIAFELAAVNSHYCKENTCHWQSICEEAVLGFDISQTESFSNTIFLWVMEKANKSAVVKI